MYFKNFTFKEIFAHCTKSEIIDALGNKKVMANVLDLLHLLQQIRDLADCAIYVNSAYRDETHNKREGGVPNSQHLEGQAADIQTPCNMQKLFRAITQFATDHPHSIGQVIMYLPKNKFIDNKTDNLEDLEYLSQFATFYHVALPNDKYIRFTPLIQIV